MWRYGGVTEEKKKSMGRYPWNLRPEKSKKPRVATHGLFGAFKEKQGNLVKLFANRIKKSLRRTNNRARKT